MANIMKNHIQMNLNIGGNDIKFVTVSTVDKSITNKLLRKVAATINGKEASTPEVAELAARVRGEIVYGLAFGYMMNEDMMAVLDSYIKGNLSNFSVTVGNHVLELLNNVEKTFPDVRDEDAEIANAAEQKINKLFYEIFAIVPLPNDITLNLTYVVNMPE